MDSASLCNRVNIEINATSSSAQEDIAKALANKDPFGGEQNYVDTFLT